LATLSCAVMLPSDSCGCGAADDALMIADEFASPAVLMTSPSSMMIAKSRKAFTA
jgi:hypothetical protein